MEGWEAEGHATDGEGPGPGALEYEMDMFCELCSDSTPSQRRAASSLDTSRLLRRALLHTRVLRT